MGEENWVRNGPRNVVVLKTVILGHRVPNGAKLVGDWHSPRNRIQTSARNLGGSPAPCASLLHISAVRGDRLAARGGAVCLERVPYEQVRAGAQYVCVRRPARVASGLPPLRGCSARLATFVPSVRRTSPRGSP